MSLIVGRHCKKMLKKKKIQLIIVPGAEEIRGPFSYLAKLPEPYLVELISLV